MSNGSTSPILRTSRGRHQPKRDYLKVEPLVSSKVPHQKNCIQPLEHNLINDLSSIRSDKKIISHLGLMNEFDNSIQDDSKSLQITDNGVESADKIAHMASNNESPTRNMETNKLHRGGTATESYSASGSTTPKCSKRQKLSFTPQMIEKKSRNDGSKSSDQSTVGAVTEFCSLDDTLMNCDIDKLFESCIDNGNVEENLKASVAEPVNHPSTKNYAVQLPGKSCVALKGRVNHINAPRNSRNRASFAQETYTSPNKFQIKVRRKSPVVLENSKQNRKIDINTKENSQINISKLPALSEHILNENHSHSEMDKINDQLKEEKFRKPITISKSNCVDNVCPSKKVLQKENASIANEKSKSNKKEIEKSTDNNRDGLKKLATPIPQAEAKPSKQLNKIDCQNSGENLPGCKQLQKPDTTVDLDCSVVMDSDFLEAFDQSFCFDSNKTLVVGSGRASPDLFADSESLFDSEEIIKGSADTKSVQGNNEELNNKDTSTKQSEERDAKLAISSHCDKTDELILSRQAPKEITNELVKEKPPTRNDSTRSIIKNGRPEKKTASSLVEPAVHEKPTVKPITKLSNLNGGEAISKPPINCDGQTPKTHLRASSTPSKPSTMSPAIGLQCDSVCSPPPTPVLASISAHCPKADTSAVRSPDGNVSLASSVGSSNCSTLESQNLLQRLRGQLQTSTQKTTGSGSVSQQSSVLDTSGVQQRQAAVAAALSEAGRANVAGGAVGQEIGPFFGLPAAVKELLLKHRGITGLYDWQTECITRGLGGANLLVSLPTSGGKTLVAEILMLRALLVRKKHAIFLLPYVAIVQEKVRGMSPLAVELGFLLEEYAGNKGSYPPKQRTKKSVAFIATTEKATGLINSFLETGRAGEVGLVVVDEAHMLGDQGGRGALLEATITKLRHAASHVQLVAMSATISNLQQLSQFLGADLYTGDFRPVKLRQYVKINDQVSEINPAALTDQEIVVNHKVVNYGYSPSERRRDQDGLGGLVREVVPTHSVLVFCPTRRNCESVAKLLCSLLPGTLTRHNREQKRQLYYALAKEGGGSVCPVLEQVLPYGVAYHHSGLTEGERKLVEEGYLTGTLCVITCTSTLAAGVNLPARRVILRSPYTGRERLTRSRYMQMVGRAGRAGLDSEGESFLVMQQKDVHMIPDLVRGPVETCLSRLCDDADSSTTPYAHATAYKPPRHSDGNTTTSNSTKANIELAASGGSDTSVAGGSDLGSSALVHNLTRCSGLRDLVFSSVGLGIVSNLTQAMDLVNCSLMALQADQQGVNLQAMVVDVLEKLRMYGILRIKDPSITETAATSGNRSTTGGGGSGGGTTTGSKLSKATGEVSPTLSGSTSVSSYSLGMAAGGDMEGLSDVTMRLHTSLLPHHDLAVSRLGRAAIKGCVELSIASRLYEDLILARNSLAVHSRLHLLFLVTPYGAAQEVHLVPQAFYKAFCGLKREEVKVAELIGITEAVATRVAMAKTKTLRSEVVKRFNAALILHRLLSGDDMWKVSTLFEVPRGLLQRTLSAASAFASCVHHFCQELEELWAFRDLLASFSRQLSGCCSQHLLPLVDLPAVKLGRARLLYAAGYTSLHAVANADPDALVTVVHHLPRHTALQIVHSAKALLLEKAEALQEEAEQVLLGLTEFSSQPAPAIV